MLDQPVNRRFVGAALRRHRERLGYHLTDVAPILECTPSKLSQIENGERGIRPGDLLTLLDAYGVADAEQKALTAAADPRFAHGWWEAYGDILPAGLAGYYLLEALSVQILAYHAHRIPDLLQSPGYARAVAEATSLPGMQHDPGREVAAVQARQQVILHDRGLPVTAIIGEVALRQLAGAEALREQLQWLIGMPRTHRPVTIQVLPLDKLAHTSVTSGSLEALRFPGAVELGVVRWAATSGIQICHVSPANVTEAVRAFGQLKNAALNPSASQHLLRSLL